MGFNLSQNRAVRRSRDCPDGKRRLQTFVARVELHSGAPSLPLTFKPARAAEEGGCRRACA